MVLILDHFLVFIEDPIGHTGFKIDPKIIVSIVFFVNGFYDLLVQQLDVGMYVVFMTILLPTAVSNASRTPS
jgi:hypothetical protein